MRFSTRVALAVCLTTVVGVTAGMAAGHFVRAWNLVPAAAWIVAVLLVAPIALWSARMLNHRIAVLQDDLGNALRATRDGDYSLRLTVRGDLELAELKRLYNELADAVRADRATVHNKEILLDTVLQRTPIAVVLLNAAERVIYSNEAARDLLSPGSILNDRTLAGIVPDLDPRLADILAAGTDALLNSGEETFHVTQRLFRLHTQEHRLILIERLTPELRRHEVAVWKRAIRLINHEINNSIAPISSLFHSARRVQEMPEHRHRLSEIYESIEERLRFLRTFLDSYAQFARLPEPRKEPTEWNRVLEIVRPLYPFRVEGSPAIEADMDVAQMQQVLINLVKNAIEAGGDPAEVTVSIQRAGSDSVVRVLDRGPGMAEEVMRQALVPFFTTKPSGTGLGLALCNEIVEAHGGRMRIDAREDGGTVVTCWVPLA